MLPKPEKNKKVAETSGSENPQDPAVLAKKLKNKRRLVLITIIATVGVSVIFSTYRFCKDFIDQRKVSNFSFNFKIPNINISSQKNLSIEPDIKKNMGSSYEESSFYIGIASPSSVIWKKDSQNNFDSQTIDNITQKILKLPPSKSDLSKQLPEGIVVQESLSNKDSFDYQTVITTPKQKFLIIIQSPQNDSNLEDSLPIMINKIYWDLVQVTSN